MRREAIVRQVAPLIVAVATVTVGLAGCGGGGPATAAVHSATPHAAPAHTVVRTYPDEAADAALCKTYNADISNGDTYDIGTALQQAGGSVSPKLAQDIQAVVNGGTLQQDMQTQLKVAVDCALVKVGVSPGT